jgi:hypothetical protein
VPLLVRSRSIGRSRRAQPIDGDRDGGHRRTFRRRALV